jgi:putative ABC transport system ATP-binding protein
VLSVAPFSFSFHSGNQAGLFKPLQLPALTALPGELVWLAGNSGCGKTILLNLIAGLIPAPKGFIHFFDTDITLLGSRDKFAELTHAIGFIPQEPLLIDSLTALQNVTLPHELMGCSVTEHINALFKALDIERVAQRKPSQLSRGQQQRVSIARAFANKPALLLADEPTANLDDDRVNVVMALIKQLLAENGTAAVIASHDSRIAPYCTRKVVFA